MDQEFQREDRYIVIKRSDADKCLGQINSKNLREICDTLTRFRDYHGKKPLQCVVVESDWPEYEYVWELLRTRSKEVEKLHEKLNAGIDREQGLEVALGLLSDQVEELIKERDELRAGTKAPK